MKKKTNKEIKGWKPKKWVDKITINLKTGERKCHYFCPKTKEEEDRLEAESTKKWNEVFDYLFSKDFSKKRKDDIK